MPQSFYEDIVCSNATFLSRYQEFKESIRKGELGETQQFCLLLYLDLMQTQHFIHLAVQDNYFEMRLCCWKFYLPLYFALQKTNNARYGSHYVKVMENVEKMYPGLKDLHEQHGMSVQAQETFPVRIAIDQRGEQMVNRDAKTWGGMKSFAADCSAILKWTLKSGRKSGKYQNTPSSQRLTMPVMPTNLFSHHRFCNQKNSCRPL